MKKLRIKPKYIPVVTAVITSLAMSGVISLFYAIIRSGLSLEMLAAWPLAWMQGWLVAFPVALIVPRQVRKLVANLSKD